MSVSQVSSLSFPVDKFLKREDYGKDKKAAVIYLLALNQPKATIQKELDKRDCNYQEPKYKLTALMVAVMVKNYGVLKYLLFTKKANATLQDKAGLTALHYACVLHDSESIKLLQEADKSKKIHIDVFAIFPGWKAVLQPQFPNDDAVIGCQRTEKGIVSLTAKEFQEMTKIRFYRGVVGEEKDLVAFFAARLEDAPDVTDEEFEKYVREQFYTKERPELGLEKQGRAGWGVFANQTVKIGRLLDIYGGSIDSSGSNDLYRIQNGVIGSKIGNFIVMINDGWPNVVPGRCRLEDGREYLACIAGKSLEKGEQIFWNYGKRHPVKNIVREEHKLKEIEEYFAHTTFKKLAQEIINPTFLDFQKDYLEQFFAIELKIQRLKYLFTTPNLLYRLFFKDILKLEDLIYMRDSTPFLDDFEVKESTEAAIKHFSWSERVIKAMQDPKSVSAFRNIFGIFAKEHSYHALGLTFEFFMENTKDLGVISKYLEDAMAAMSFIDSVIECLFRKEIVPNLLEAKKKIEHISLEVKKEICLEYLENLEGDMKAKIRGAVGL